jgi:hypothetical protein
LLLGRHYALKMPGRNAEAGKQSEGKHRDPHGRLSGSVRGEGRQTGATWLMKVYSQAAVGPSGL